MAKTYVLSRAFEQPVVTARDASGRATDTHPTRVVWAPALYAWITNFSVIEGRGTRDWTLCVVADGQAVPAAADSDPDMRVIEGSDLAQSLSTAVRGRINSRLALTDLGVTATAGDTRRTLMRKIALALGHHTEFDVGRF